MEDALLALVPFLAEQIGAFVAPKAAEETSRPSSVPVPRSIPALPVPRNTTPVQVPTHGAGVTVPFQQEWVGITGNEQGIASILITELHPIKALLPPFCNARLTKLEVVIFASARSVTEPVTVDLVWTPAHYVAGGDRFLDHAGATTFTVGGLDITNGGSLPAPLQYLNPVIKSAIPYVDTPRLNIKYHQMNKEINKGRIASVVIRGEVMLDTPSVF